MTATDPAGTATAPFPYKSTRATAPPSVGLSSGHKPPYTRQHPRWTDRQLPVRFSLKYAPESLLVRASCQFGPRVEKPSWRRGRVGGLSRKSRGRCVQTLATVPWDQLSIRPIFLTLTYPADYPGDWRVWKRHLEAFFKRLRRGYTYRTPDGNWHTVEFPDAAAIWRLELQERGAPHFHLILFNVPWLHIPWLDSAWAGVVDADDVKHERAGTRIEWPKKWKGTVAYVAKYVAKQAQKPALKAWAVDMDGSAAPVHEEIGRHWGVVGRQYLPQSIAELDVDAETFEAIKAVLIDARGDDKGEEWLRAPFRGLWGTCGPAAVEGILASAGLITRGDQ